MGMAASQARYLGLTARKTNVEYEGQQINQARTALANQSANTFNDLLNLEVPTAPSTQDFTTLKYSYTDGTQDEVISDMTQLQNDPDGYNYLVTHYHYANIYTGVQNKLANPQVVEGDVSTKGSTSRDDIGYLEQPTYTINGSQATTYDPANAAQKDIFDRLVVDYPDMNPDDMMTYTDPAGTLHFVSRTELGGTADINDRFIDPATDTPADQTTLRADITATEPVNKTYTVNGHPVTAYDPTNLEQKKVYDKLKTDYPSIGNDTSDLRCYTDDDGNMHMVSQAGLEGTGDITDYYVEAGIPTYVGNAQLSKYDSTDPDMKAAYEQILKDWPDSDFALADPDDIYTYQWQGQTRFACAKDLTSSAISGPDQTLPTENQDKLTYYVAQDVKTKIELTEKAMVDLDEKGRPQSIKYQDSSLTHVLNTETETDEAAYQDAMNQYNYDMQVYEKAIQDINAKTEKIQEQDRTLELRLRQLDTEQEALQTEMEAVKKVIDKNIESTFKTFDS